MTLARTLTLTLTLTCTLTLTLTLTPHPKGSPSPSPSPSASPSPTPGVTGLLIVGGLGIAIGYSIEAALGLGTRARSAYPY